MQNNFFKSFAVILRYDFTTAKSLRMHAYYTARTLSDFAKQNCIEGFLFLISFSLFAQPPLEELRPLFERAQQGNLSAKMWCHAIVAVHTSELKNRLLYDHNTSEQSLLKQLFHVNVGGEFRTSRHEPICYINKNSLPFLMTQLQEHHNNTAEITTAEAQELSKTFSVTKKNLIKNKPLKDFISLVRNVPDRSFTLKVLLGLIYLKSQSVADFYRTRNSSFQETDYQRYQEWAGTIRNNDVMQIQTITDFMHHNSALIVYSQLKQREHVSGLPPKLYYVDIAPDATIAPVRDCCETVIQEFVNRLLYNAQTQQFELSRVPSSCTLHPACVAFYQKFNSAKTIQEVNDHARRIAWMKLISNISGAVYRKNKNGIAYEVHPSVKNFNHIFRHLIGVEPLNCTTVLDTRLRIKNLPAHDTHTDILFGFASSSTQEQTFTLHIRKDHAWITDDNQTVKIALSPSANDNTCTHEQELVKQVAASNNVVLRHLFGFALPVHAIADPEEQKRLLFSHQTETDAQKYSLLRKLLLCAKTNATLLPCACAVVRDMYHTEIIKNALMRCIESKIQSNQEVKPLILEKIFVVDPLQKQQVLLCMAQHDLHTDPEFNQSMKQLIAEIPDSELSDDEKLTIDTKVHTLARLLKTNVVHDNDIMDSVEVQVMQLDFERFKKLQRIMENIR